MQRSLVDPDNRRLVDFDRFRRTTRLALDDGESSRGLADDKLWLTSRALRLRRQRPAAVRAPVHLPRATHDFPAPARLRAQ
ncbi:MAG: hypothetical protein WKF73_12190 [Nocardioidaceae bacterium]